MAKISDCPASRLQAVVGVELYIQTGVELYKLGLNGPTKIQKSSKIDSRTKLPRQKRAGLQGKDPARHFHELHL